MRTKIILYDDNEALGSSIKLMIEEEDDLEVTAFFAGAETVVEDIRVLKPDVVLMDIDMPVVSGVEAVKNIRKTNKQLPIIMLTVFDDNENIFNAICAGASGYILKVAPQKKFPAPSAMYLPAVHL
ncbi:MAG: response regulator transcription factor [Bacteroidota bacterium]